MNNVAKQGACAPVLSGPVAHKRPGPARLRNKTRAEVLRGIDSAMDDMDRERGCTVPAEQRLRGALCYLQGWLKESEPELSEKLAELMRRAAA